MNYHYGIIQVRTIHAIIVRSGSQVSLERRRHMAVTYAIGNSIAVLSAIHVFQL
jgi:hypothetical protein